ncbi:hypothetical protein MAR_005103 [Mya arenaria]|uniref:C-type lectin domain-containing protein n=1 Tax=Mya arenaria TaxID=6604 RepID=A0ABY7EYI5_MYAAR|nr:hypothetical protein MAR_005103 [Mya arenaria]
MNVNTESWMQASTALRSKLRLNRTTTDTVWIGITNTFGEYVAGNGGWINYGQGPQTYTNWETGYPLTTSKYNCGYMLNGSPNTKWRNAQCLDSKKAVCEYPSEQTTPTKR